MPAAATDWKSEFGLDREARGTFLADISEIDAAGSQAPQSHSLRRAFGQLELDGILCQDQSPVIYFKEVDDLQPAKIAELHKRFWNHGITPILVLIAPDEVQVYSGFLRPGASGSVSAQPSGFVQQLARVADELELFLISVTTGEFFRQHAKSFDPRQRVDRDLLRNLKAAREKLNDVTAQPERLAPEVLDALLCRLIFTCYLFDRGVIDTDYLKALGLDAATHLRDILRQLPRSKARADLYRLFEQLGEDFNGDLFSDDLAAESRKVTAKHLEVLDSFFHGTDVNTGQQSFWPYDFRIIPIETISAIYEHFLKAADADAKKKAGAFYTPRFLAELVLDTTLRDVPSLLDKKYLDPACGSGIFLVGLFHRLADEWKRANPNARYDRRANELLKILREKLFGVDRNLTACRITAFSLYLAFLDQLAPPDIRELQRKGKMLPKLVYDPETHEAGQPIGTICHADFFTNEPAIPVGVDFVIGNPPWAKVEEKDTPVAHWCANQKIKLPDDQLVYGFVSKAPLHLLPEGRVTFVLPHRVLFNHKSTAVRYQETWFKKCAVESVLNLADFQRFLFEESEAPAVVVSYRQGPPLSSSHRIEYWAPKTGWNVKQSEILDILPQDRSRLTLREFLNDLQGVDAPQIWKRHFWPTPRDWRLLDRFCMLPRLRDIVGKPSDEPQKRWLIAQGFEERDTGETKLLQLPTERIVEARSKSLNLFLDECDCSALPSKVVNVRLKSNTNTRIYVGPHVLITHGFSRVAFARCDVSFRHAVRGIHGPLADAELLAFLAVYLRTKLARYFLFHTSANWGVSRQKVHGDELLRLPFPLPEQTTNARESLRIIHAVANLVSDATEESKGDLVDREALVRKTQTAAEKLVEEYFDIDPIERLLIADTNRIIIPSVRPTRKRIEVPTIKSSTPDQRGSYARRLCETLNDFASGGKHEIHATTLASTEMGVGVAVLEKTRRGEPPRHLPDGASPLLPLLRRLESIAAKSLGSVQLVRGVKVFHENLLYVVKPIGQRFWSATTALNDADEIATTILMRSSKEKA